MHKKIRLFVSMLAAAAMLVFLPGSSLTVRAAEGNTYSLKYIGGDVNDWRYVSGSTFEDGMYHRELYTLTTYDLKDGDNIVVYPGDGAPAKNLDLGSFNLGSVTIHQGAQAVVNTSGVIKDCYVLNGAYASVNGEVTNAYLYDNATCTFHNNVLYMVLYITDVPHSNISCGGTVGEFRIYTTAGESRGAFYDIPVNTMRLTDGTIQFPVWSPNPSEAYLQAKAEADGTAASQPPASEPPADSSAPSAPATDTAADEYDQVPKTGEDGTGLWVITLTGAAAVLFTASCRLSRKVK